MQTAHPGILELGGRFLSSTTASDTERYRWLLLLRFVLTNITGFALLAAAWASGWLDQIVATDTQHLCLLIFAVFLVGVGRATDRVWMLSQELNDLASERVGTGSKIGEGLAALHGTDSTGRATLAAALKLKLSQRIGSVRWIASTLVLLGLIGTVIGFVMALGGVDPARASDPAAIGPMVSTLIAGMSVALYTTLVGSVLNIWLMINYRLLEGGSVHLLTRFVEIGERHGRA
jgi:biopolymer transport protein ExbB/TolQ